MFGGVGEKGVELSQMVPGMGLEKLPAEACCKLGMKVDVLSPLQIDDLLDMGNIDQRMRLMELASLRG